MGFAIAQAAYRLGASVRLISGPVTLPDPYGIDLVKVNTAQEMLASVSEYLPKADVSIFAAAVSDYRPRSVNDKKIKRSKENTAYALDLIENPDVALDTLGNRKEDSITVGFALETESILENAQKKLKRKQFDFLVANSAAEADAGFDVETNRVILLFPGGRCEEVPLMTKHEVSEVVLSHILQLLENRL
jgi:phosphopantothenoylcysteine decarboxylase/phosphopantothenate--cysteine ligase